MWQSLLALSGQSGSGKLLVLGCLDGCIHRGRRVLHRVRSCPGSLAAAARLARGLHPRRPRLLLQVRARRRALATSVLLLLLLLLLCGDRTAVAATERLGAPRLGCFGAQDVLGVAQCRGLSGGGGPRPPGVLFLGAGAVGADSWVERRGHGGEVAPFVLRLWHLEMG